MRVAVNTQSTKTAKPKSATAVTAVSLRCGVAEGDAAAVADDANRRLWARLGLPWKGKMQFLLLPKKAIPRVTTLQSKRRVSAPRRPRPLKLGQSKIGQSRLGLSRPGQWMLDQLTPGPSRAGQSDLGLSLGTRVLAHNADPSRADPIRADRIRGARTRADQKRADRN